MKKIFFLLFFLSFIYSKTDSLEVKVLYNETDIVVRTFEIALLKKIVSIYNTKNTQKLKLVFELRNKPNEVWFYFNKKELIGKHGLTCGLISASITPNDPKYDYSDPYLPIQDVLIGRVDDPMPNKNSTFRLVHMKSNYYKPIISSLKKDYKMIITETPSYNEAVSFFLSGKADYYLGDSIDSWVYQNRKVALFLNDKVTYLGFVYPEGSELKPKLDPILSYYRKSASFYNLLKLHFGKDLKKYYQKTMSGF